MEIRRRSPLTGQLNIVDLPVTEEEIRRWHDGELVQDVWPNLSRDWREFIVTGVYPGEWDSLFSKEDDE